MAVFRHYGVRPLRLQAREGWYSSSRLATDRATTAVKS